VTRIIAGVLGGRRLIVPAGGVRPTADRVREAWFSILSERIRDATVVDLFAGSGALGLEALSRGAREATFVELEPASLAAIRSNIETLGVGGRTRVLRRDALRYVDRLEGRSFDVAFADPPYAHAAGAMLVDRFRARPFAAVLGIEHPAKRPVAGDETRRYGDTALTFCYAP